MKAKTRAAARGEARISAARAGLIRLLADETVRPPNWWHEIGAAKRAHGSFHRCITI